jgi:guanylate kinase
MTTRKPRPGEKEGVNYYFTDKQSFEKMVKENKFLEYAEVYGNYYGTPREYVEEKIASGFDVLLEIDIQGALQVKDKYPDGVFIFIIPPSMDELKRRIIKRGTESAEAIYTRFQSAYHELTYLSQYSYVVVNDTVDEAVRRLEAIVLAEKCRVARNKGLYLGL